MRSLQPHTHTHTQTHTHTHIHAGFHDGLAGKESACNAGDPDSISGWEDPLEKEMATHASILAWRVPWTEESGATMHRVAKSGTRLSE